MGKINNVNLDGDISNKLNALLALALRILLKDADFSEQARKKRRTGASDLVSYFANFDLSPNDIAAILGAPVQSVRTMLTPSRRRGR